MVIITFSSNNYLSKEEMLVNANHIMSSLLSKGWSKESIAGMLGNMETESTINPGLWQGQHSGNMSGGYGLVQWTPATNYINWANSNGYPIGELDGQIARLIHELDNGLQYIKTKAYPETFEQFTKSRKSPEYLASAFLKNYERAGISREKVRQTQARYWFETADGKGGGGGTPFYPAPDHLPFSSSYGMRFHPIDNVWRFHDGMDISGGGQHHPIYATQSGTVITNSYNDISGWYIRIEHTGDEYFSGYQHLAVQSPLSVGTVVTKGQDIGIMGTTGSSTGIHLHFQIAIHNNGWYTEEGTIDPELYLQMDFGDGALEPNKKSPVKDVVMLLLSDSLNGWKY